MLGELIVKLKPEAGEQVEQALEANRIPTNTGLGWFDELNERYGVTKIEPVFSAHRDVEAIKQQFPERTRRAPPGATTSSLKYVYKLAMSPSVPVLQAASDYEAHPDVEYAHPNYIATIQTQTLGLP